MQKSPVLQHTRAMDSAMNTRLHSLSLLSKDKDNRILHAQPGMDNEHVTSGRTKAYKPLVVPSIPARSLSGGTCIDTSVRLVYRKDPVAFANDWITKTRDGNILIPGWEYNYQTFEAGPHLIKCTQQGDTIWSRLIKAGFPNRFSDVYKAFELNDNSILLVGNMDIPMPYNGRNDLMMLRVTATGRLIWEKTFKTRLWDVDTTSGSIDILDCRQDAAGDMYLCGDVRYDALPRVGLGFKMDLSGNVIWSRAYGIGAYPRLNGVNITSQGVTFLGRVLSGNSILPVGIVMDPASGDTISTTAFVSPTGDFWHGFYADNTVKLQNGNLALFGSGASDGSTFDTTQIPTHAGIIEITPDLKFVQSYILRSATASNSYNTVTTVFDDGSAAFIRLNYITSWSGDVLYGSFKNGQILKERVVPYRGLGIAWSSNFLKMDDGGQIITNFIGDSAANVNDVEFVKLHNSDTSGSCLGNDTTVTFVEKQYYYNVNLYVDSVVSDVLTENYRPFDGIYNDSFVIASNCKQVSFCDSLKLLVSRDTICANSIVSISIKKNKECGAMPLWNYDTTAISSFYKLDDSTISATFSKPWQGYISASIEGCKTLLDSVRLTVLQAPSLLELGPDTVLCPGNSILLNAKKGYASYVWQDGSVDSTFIVTAPGKYYVKTRDACGGSFTDTVVVASHPPIPFDIGPDLFICKNDTVNIAAPPGFIHYQWTSYNISNDTAQVVNVFPSMNTWYKVIAEKTPGCFASDSLYVSIKNVPAINLGNDTSFCAGQFVTLNAGPGFDTWLWNTGSQNQKITVNQQGTYAVKATLNGCSSYDTLKVVNVYPLPLFSLGNDTALCQGQQLSLSFNLQQATYKWNTGSALNSITISQAGTYWLQVSRQGCAKADTINIVYNPSPVVRLGNDTTLCENQTLQLDAFNNNATYLWQDRSSAPRYLVNNAGTYFVSVDLNKCHAADTILVSYKALPLFTLGKDSFLCAGQQYNLKPSLNTNASLLWQDGSASPVFTISKEGIYTLIASNECGSYKDSVIITSGICNIIMPSAFTPNGDGLNDVFKLKYPFPVNKFNMIIYDRWGEKVFETNTITSGWNGMWKGVPSLQGAYVWTIWYTDDNNKQQQLKGVVNLLR